MDNDNINVLDEQHELVVRRTKLEELKASGKNPFEIVRFDRDTYISDIKSDFEAKENTDVTIAGRLMSRRDMGKANFIDILDSTGRIQAYVRIDDLGEAAWNEFKKWDLGDIVGLTGFVFRTRRGEISVHTKKIELLSKSLLPLPEKFHGLKDQDTRYRRRYLDLIANPEVKETFIKRSKILSEIRKYLDALGYIEVDTPVLHTIEIGAAARSFKTHHNALDIDMYLRIETELYLKRLIVGGFDKVYEVGRIFRNEGMDATHNPEFTSIEMYQAYIDYFQMMDIIEGLYLHLAKTICGSGKIPYQGNIIDMETPWERLSMIDAVKKYANVDYLTWSSDEDARKCAKAHDLHVDEGDAATKGHVLIAFFEEYVEPKLVQPTFIYDYPVENSPLAKRKANDKMFTERFEFFINCSEMGNAFSELNDPVDQRERFEKQVAAKRAKGENASIDEDFIMALEHGMPPTAGLGFGVDRLVMLLTDCSTIRDVLLFPTMKPISN